MNKSTIVVLRKFKGGVVGVSAKILRVCWISIVGGREQGKQGKQGKLGKQGKQGKLGKQGKQGNQLMSLSLVNL